ncbi:MAG: hypothetical protein EOM13_02265, partial [Clostridia bacterium]|nr:hypothetical protein [Clostridia bacterium]
MEQVRIGIIGIGNMGSAHAKMIANNEIDGMKLAAIADLDPARRRWAADQLPADVTVYETGGELIENAEIDAVLVAVPHYSHAPLTIAALENNLHVLCEKPVAVTTRQAEAMIKAADQSDRYFALMFNQRTNPLYRKAKELLESGELAQANQLLGRPYRLLGSVSRGIARGREFGFPTANLMLSNPHQLIPKEGIYLSKVHLGHKGFFGLTNIGKSPTVKHTGIIEIETFLIDFAGDLYGEGMQVELIKYLREEKMFANTDELIQAMHRDLQRAREL